MTIRGPYRDITNDRWRVLWESDGQRKKKTFRTREEAEAFKRSLQPQEPAATPRTVPAYNATGKWWNDRLGELAVALMSRPGDEETRRDCRTMAQLATAVKDFLDLAELEAKVSKHERIFAEITSASKEGTRLPASFDDN